MPANTSPAWRTCFPTRWAGGVVSRDSGTIAFHDSGTPELPAGYRCTGTSGVGTFSSRSADPRVSRCPSGGVAGRVGRVAECPPTGSMAVFRRFCRAEYRGAPGPDLPLAAESPSVPLAGILPGARAWLPCRNGDRCTTGQTHALKRSVPAAVRPLIRAVSAVTGSACPVCHSSRPHPGGEPCGW